MYSVDCFHSYFVVMLEDFYKSWRHYLDCLVGYHVDLGLVGVALLSRLDVTADSRESVGKVLGILQALLD